MLKNILLITTKSALKNRKYLSNTTLYYSNIAATPPDAFNLQQNHIEEAIKLVPNLGKYTPDIWQRTHLTFANHGLQTINFLRIVTGNPHILKRTPQQIVDSLEMWRSCQFGEKFLHMLITKYPELLDFTEAHNFLAHIAYLKSLFHTNKNVWKVLMNSPDLLSQKKTCIEEKFQYFSEIMRIEVPEIVKSAAFSNHIDDIRCRHIFLERLGMYKPRPLKTDPNKPTTNPKLYQIMDTSEKTFATKICHVNLVEYEAFKELYARELKRNELLDDYDGDD